MDKDGTKDKDDNVDSGNITDKPVETVEVEIPIDQSLQTEQPLDTGMNTEGIDASTKKSTKTKTSTIEHIEKSTEAEVHIEKPVITEIPKKSNKPLLVKMQTQTDPLEDNTGKGYKC